MPIYEYECAECRKRFERKQSFHDEPVKECPECKGKVRRVLHPVGIVFKGSGFYVTDSRNAQTGTIGAKDGPGESSSETGAKSETGGNGAKGEKKDAKRESASDGKSDKASKSDPVKASADKAGD